MEPRIELRIPLPIFIILLIVGVLAIIAHAVSPESIQKTISFGAALVGGTAAIYALFLNVQTRRSEAANGFIKRYNDPAFHTFRKALTDSINSRQEQVDEHTTRSLLNFFEEMALAVNCKEADDQLVKGFFFTIASKYYRSMGSFIERARTSNNQPTAYQEYEKMYKRWNKS